MMRMSFTTNNRSYKPPPSLQRPSMLKKVPAPSLQRSMPIAPKTGRSSCGCGK